MAKKYVNSHLNALKQPGRNFFSLPGQYGGPKLPNTIYYRMEGLSPNTRYKVMLNNYPGRQYEDLTNVSNPVGRSVYYNTKDSREASRNFAWDYFTSTPDGILEVEIFTHGAENIEYVNGVPNYTKLWQNFRTRTRLNDNSRDAIRFIKYSKVLNPDTDEKVKTVIFDEESPDSLLSNPTTNEFKAGPFPRVAKQPDGLAVADIVDTRQDFPRVMTKFPCDFIQSFYIDAATVNNSETVDLTDIQLYFKSRPSRKNNLSGILNPGVKICIMDMVNDAPDNSSYYAGSVVRNGFYGCIASPSALSPTTFKFSSPLRLKTNRDYAIGIFLEDRGYTLWQNVKGDLLLRDGIQTENLSPGSSEEHRGQLFLPKDNTLTSVGDNPRNEWKARDDLDIKFDVHIKEYEVQNVEVDLVNEDYEFFEVSNTAHGFWPSEPIYKVISQPAGANTVTIAAGSTKVTNATSQAVALNNLQDGDSIVITDVAGNKEIFTIDRSIGNAASATVVYVSEYSKRTITGTYEVVVRGNLDFYDYDFQTMRLKNSTANLTNYFQNGDTLYSVYSGEEFTLDSVINLPLSVVRPDWNAQLPPDFKVTTQYQFAEVTGALEEFPQDASYALNGETPTFKLNAPNFTPYNALVLSKSNEVLNSGNLFTANTSGTVGKSAHLKLNYTFKDSASNKSYLTYSAPTIKIDELVMITHRWNINNDATNEHTNDGSAFTKHISKPLTFAKDNSAEDVRVIVNAHRPRTTDFKVYAKVINALDPAPLDDKYWTELNRITGDNLYSDSANRFDYQEYEFEMPLSPPADATVPGYVTTEEGNTEIVGVDTTFTSLISDGDIIKLYSEEFPDNYQVISVDTVNSDTSITLSDPIANVNIIGDGFKIDTLETPYTAFKNPDNYQICRYYDENNVPYDTYNTVVIKIVLLAESRSTVPRIDDYRVIGVSA